MMDEDPLSDLDDAIIEGTCRCQCCDATFTLGGNNGIITEIAMPGNRVRQHVLCVECAGAVAKAFHEACRDACVCEHGVADGDWCEECAKEYHNARREAGDETAT